MLKFIFILFTSLLLASIKASTNDNLLDLISKNQDFSTFYELIKIANYQELFNEKTKFKKIIYIPNNKAFQNLPKKIKQKIMNKDLAKKVIRTHLYSGEVKEVFKNPKKKVVILERVELNGETVKIFSNNDLFVKDVVNQDFHLEEDEYTIIPVDCVMFLQLSSDDRRLSEEEKNNSIVTSCCLLTDNEIDTFLSDQNL